MNIKPYNNNILVELKSKYKHALTTDARTVETKDRGLCVAISSNLTLPKEKNLVDKIVYFDEFEDTTNYTVDGKKYALIDVKNIKGYEDV